MTKTKRKPEQKQFKDARTGQPLTHKQFADLVNAYEVENRQETQVSAYKDGLGRFLKSKGFLVFVLLIFPPLALLSGCAYNSNTTIKGDRGSDNAGVSTSSSCSTNFSIGGKDPNQILKLI